MTVLMPPMVPEQEAGWLALFEVSERMPHGWALVGGQLVHLHCAERGASPPRPTTDLDTVLDVRGYPLALRDFTRVLLDIGFSSAGVSPAGHQHRFIRGDAVIDVLIPRHLGDVAANRTGATGSSTIAAPGSQQALDRSEPVEVEVADRRGMARRPNLVGALVGKASTVDIIIDEGRERHIEDFTILVSMLTAADLSGVTLTKLDVQRLGNMVYLAQQSGVAVHVDGAARGLRLLRMALDRAGRS